MEYDARFLARLPVDLSSVCLWFKAYRMHTVAVTPGEDGFMAVSLPSC